MTASEHSNQFEQEMLWGGYEQLIAKPPQGINDWPLSKVICFKNAVCAANTAYERASTGKSRHMMLRFLSRAKRVIEFYQEGGNNVD
jgi:hypothetical protein